MITLPRQTKQRLAFWYEELGRHLYSPAAAIAFEGFTTFDRLTPEQAETMPKRPFPAGTAWGACWEYGWFAADVTVPASCEGQRVVFFSGLEGEQLVYVNGKAAGSIDKEHKYVVLTRCAKAGESFHLLIESYAGHGARLENCGPCPPERKAVPAVPDCQCQVKESFAALWHEDAYQLWMDVTTLTHLLQVLPDRSLRAQKVARALVDYTHIADFELPMKERHESFRKAREALKDALDCHNGSTAPTLWMVANSHIDLAWLWPAEETFHKTARTFSNQLALMEEYPEYRFLLCEPALLDMCREYSPEMWSRVKAAFDRGQFMADGVFYVECDTNFPGGESLIRQIAWGKKWFRENLGVDAKVAWHPDTFGYSAALPQLLRAFGVPYFATQKLLRADPECERFPYQNFVWEGMDGTEILSLSYFNSNSKVDPVDFHMRWETHRTQTEDIDTLLYPYGYGDGGGGPTRDQVEMVRRTADLEGLPRTHQGTVEGFFREMEKNPPKNRWVGELYLAWHRGTYTVQHHTKQLLRRAERAVHDAEALLARCGKDLQEQCAARLRKAWEIVLFCQFHDVVSGVGIRRVREEAFEWLTRVIADMADMNAMLRRSVFGVAAGDGYVLINTLPWQRDAWVELPDGRLCHAHLPADGAVMACSCAQPDDVSAVKTADGFVLENCFMRLTVDGEGRIIALTDKENGLPLMAPGMKMNDWRLYQNVESVYDAWEMSSDWKECILPGAITAHAELTEATPQRAVITVERSFGQSSSVQRIVLHASSRRVDFITHVDWHEHHKLLKTHFESNILCSEAVHEIQFGHVTRPTHDSHAFASDRYETCNQRFTALCESSRGFALLNESSCGVSTGRGEAALSLLRAPLVPDDTCDRGEHDLTYSLYPFAAAFADSGVVQAGYELNCPVEVMQGECAEQKGFGCEGSSVVLETVKPADDGNGVILRLYESQRMHAAGCVTASGKGRWYLCDMPESVQGEYLGEGESVTATLRPFEVQTLRFVPEA